MMKRILALLLALMVLLTVTACGNTTAADPTTTAAPTEEPEVFTSISLIQNGASEYVIVHDGSEAAKTLAADLQGMIGMSYGVLLKVVSMDQQAQGTYEIVVGQSRDIAQKTMNKLTGEFDFALKVEENTLVLCAKNDLSYAYLGQYLKREVFVKGDTADLTLDSDDNIVYSKSALMETNLVDYDQAGNIEFSLEKHFAYEIFKNEDTTLPYRIYVPFNYSPDKQYPLLVNLHGAGLRGNDNQRQLKFIDKAMTSQELTVDDAIIIFPQCPENEQWVDATWGFGSYSMEMTPESNELKAVLELIGQLQQTYSIDAGRIYACGFSMGGFGTWDLLLRHSDIFCAGVAMCGAGDPSKAQTLVDMPIWAIHGAMDPTVPVSGSQDMAKALETAGAKDFHYTELPEADHDVWTYTYSNAEIFSWLFSQKKAA